MKSHDTRSSSSGGSCASKVVGAILAAGSLLLALPPAGHAQSVRGDSTTIMRMRETTDDSFRTPLYEYLHLSTRGSEAGGTISAHIGGWGRVDLADKSSEDRTDGDLQYGYLSYQGSKSNLVANAGRQFVTEGVASERLDGLYLRSDLAGGFEGAVFLGSPVVTEPNLAGGAFLYGGRIAHHVGDIYGIGVSALKSNAGQQRDREEEGVDLWLRPIRQVDIAGRTSYNSETGGFMEHAYTATLNPISRLKLSAAYSKINYDHYFARSTTSALSLTSTPGPGTGVLQAGERVQTIGGSAAFDVTNRLAIAADYVNFDYHLAGHANYYGGRITYYIPESYSAGLTYHRMDGVSDRLTYDEFRIYAAKRLHGLDLTLDFIDILFDSSIQGVSNTFTVVGAIGYQFLPGMTISGDVDYSRTVDMDNEVRGFIKLTYAFDTERRATK